MERFSQLLLKDSKQCISNCRTDFFQNSVVGHEIWGSKQNSNCTVDMETDGLSASAASACSKDNSFVSGGTLGHQQRNPDFPENTFQQQAELWLPNNNKKPACEKHSGCCSSPQCKPNYPHFLLHHCCCSCYLQLLRLDWEDPLIILIPQLQGFKDFKIPEKYHISQN